MLDMLPDQYIDIDIDAGVCDRPGGTGNSQINSLLPRPASTWTSPSDRPHTGIMIRPVKGGLVASWRILPGNTYP